MRKRWFPLAASVLLAVGCQTPAYVNIPAQSGDLAWSDPNTQTVRILMTEAITATLQREPIKGVFDVVLPEGATTQTYQQVVVGVGGGAITPDTLREAESTPAVRVVAVRVRGRDAEVDVLRPSPSGREAVTVTLYWYYGGDWAVQRVRPWRVPASLLIPQTTPTVAPNADRQVAPGEVPTAGPGN